LYVMEAGPLSRAAKVWVATSRAQIRDKVTDSKGIRGQTDPERHPCGF
jgi:hypothetical protein